MVWPGGGIRDLGCWSLLILDSFPASVIRCSKKRQFHPIIQDNPTQYLNMKAFTIVSAVALAAGSVSA